ncbi:glycosyltransferase [Klenkia sp. LSe6-5]|uniref:Glycosyltransferase n=1 Tax=Klenkia sesuvii TaxID=3103137 RepID=A0ABU8DPE4_9ACTN
MKVLVVTTKHAASSYYRVREPARAVSELPLGAEVVVVGGLATTMSRTPGPDGPVVVDIDDQGADVVVFQLPKTAELVQMVSILQARGVGVVVEMDDLLTAVPAGMPGHRRLVMGGMGERALECARLADHVTVSTPALLTAYAAHGRGTVVPNAVPRRVAELPPAYLREPGTATIGWAGSVHGHPYDLPEVGSGLQQALNAAPSRFVVLGEAGDAGQKLGLTHAPAEIRWLPDVDSYLRALGEEFDLGIAPLRIDRFNTAKSWLKVLEYAARGVYAVRSPSAEYERLGLGWRARAAKDWAKGLTKGLLEPEWRTAQARAAREVVLDRHLTEHTAASWVAAWERAAEHRGGVLRRSAVAVG